MECFEVPSKVGDFINGEIEICKTKEYQKAKTWAESKTKWPCNVIFKW